VPGGASVVVLDGGSTYPFTRYSEAPFTLNDFHRIIVLRKTYRHSRYNKRVLRNRSVEHILIPFWGLSCTNILRKIGGIDAHHNESDIKLYIGPQVIAASLCRGHFFHQLLSLRENAVVL
jgi:hypothetical protein